MVNSANELSVPEWLNKQFFEHILSQKLAGQRVKISELIATKGAAKNDHYASVMFRVKIDYSILSENGEQKQHQSLILKTMPAADSQKNDLLEEYDLFQIEIRMYSETLPKIEQILNAYGDQTKLCANLFYYSLKPQKCIIFEDLGELGYTTIANRHCTMDEVKTALEKLAKLHAVSYKLAKEGDTSITAYTGGSFSDEKIFDLEFLGGAIKLLKEVIEQYDDLRVYLPHIEKIEPTIFKHIVDSFKAFSSNGARNDIFVLNHGDFHMKNIMVKQTNGKLNDLMLLDYQLCYFGSSALDVIFAIITLFSPEMRLKHRDELIYHYFTHFQATLRLIGYKERVPTLIDFQHKLLQHAQYEFFSAITAILMNYTFSSADGDLSKLLEDKEYRRKLLQRPDVLAELRVLLPHYLHRGYLEAQ